MNNARKIAPWVSIMVYLIVVLSFVAARRKEVVCSDIKISIANNSSDYFIEEADVLALLNDKGEKLKGLPMESIKVNGLEQLLSLHPSVKNANVYRNLTGYVNINIEQRQPILRVINSNRESYYIDDEGALMPLSTKYTAHVLVASGQISQLYAKNKEIKLGSKSVQIVDNSNVLLFDLYQLASYIYADKFWRAQIEQIYVVNNEFELVPRVGSHIVEFGTIQQYDKKFKKLKALYSNGLPEVGWNKYVKVNLKYNNQVICTKR